MGAGDSPEYFAHFEPTRTWKWLNSKEDGIRTDEQNIDEESEEENDDCNASTSNDSVSEELGAEDEQNLEGSSQSERGRALLEYGFECQCKRCTNHQSESNR